MRYDRIVWVAALMLLQSSLANAAPVLKNDSASVSEAGSVTVSVLANDLPSGGVLIPSTVDIYQPEQGRYFPENGYLSMDGLGRISYYHYGGPTTSDRFFYIASDSNGDRGEPATVFITIGESVNNLPPVANDDSASLDTGESVDIAILNNDSDPDGQLSASSVSITRLPQFGSVNVRASGAVTYTHDGSQRTADSFEYTVEDSEGDLSNRATVTLSIQSAQNAVPLARNDVATVVQGAGVNVSVLSNDADADGALVGSTVLITSAPLNGSVQVLDNGVVAYQHEGGESQTDSFTYTVEDNEGAVSNTASVSITVQPVTVDGVTLLNDAGGVREGGSVIIDVLANDLPVNGGMNPSSVDIFQPVDGRYFPEHGYLSIDAAGRISYFHYGGESTSDVFYYIARDNSGVYGEPASVAISIGDSSANVAPQAFNDSASLNASGSVTIRVLGNDIDSDGQLVPASVSVNQPLYGQASVAVNGDITYRHGGNATTTDSFSYTVKDDDGAVSNRAVVSLTILPAQGNLPPIANADAVELTRGTSRTISLVANDTDTDGLVDAASVVIVRQPDYAESFSVAANGSVFYRHNGGGGSDSFTYTITDDEGAVSNIATVTINILPVIDGGSLAAFHRSGQTFLTWEETGGSHRYHVYRHNAPITPQNLSQAVRLTEKWGPLGSDTSVNVHGGPNVPRNFVISDLAAPLTDSTGLFVYTTQPGDSSRAYYAVTTVVGSGERTNTVIASSISMSESVATPADVLTVSVNAGKGRIYTQFMDYSNWNPTFNGYAYNYTVALPSNYVSGNAYPLMVELHAYYEVFKWISESEYNWPVITLLPHDPGPTVGALHSWWYGYSRDHNYSTRGAVPSAGAVENFTEQRVMRAIDAIVADSAFEVDTNKIHAYGNSMGASGALSLGIRYGNIISGIYANQPMTNYRSNPLFQDELVQIWGNKSSNLPVVNAGPNSEIIQLYGQGGVSPVGVWDWMDHHQQLVERRGDTLAYLMTFHGKQDTIIDWATQGKPTARALTDADAGFAAVNGGSEGHTWGGFRSVSVNMFGFGYDADFAWKYPLNLSYPSITNASGSSAVDSSNFGNDNYNMSIEWATPHSGFAPSIVDLPGRYEISLRSSSTNQSADITPRRTQQFDPNPGQVCSWTVTQNDSGQQIAAGSATTDIDSLLTVRSVPIRTGSGTRLSINCG